MGVLELWSLEDDLAELNFSCIAVGKTSSKCIRQKNVTLDSWRDLGYLLTNMRPKKN
jgi:hypothetical protein